MLLRSNKIYLFLLVHSKKKKIVLCFTVSDLPKRTGEREWGSALVNPENNDFTPAFWTKTGVSLTRRSKIATKRTEAKVKGRKIQKLRKSLRCVTVSFRVTSLNSPR